MFSCELCEISKNTFLQNTPDDCFRNNLEITSTLYLCNKIWIIKSVSTYRIFIYFALHAMFSYKQNINNNWSFSLNNPPSRFFIFAIRKLWNYSVQVFLVGFSSFLLSIDLRPVTSLKKRLWHRCFPANFVKFLRTTFLIEHFWWLLLYRLTKKSDYSSL